MSRVNDLWVLHDPHDEGWDGSADGTPCPICDEPWPCAERKRQRGVTRRVIADLSSRGYSRGADFPNDPEGMRWWNAAGWSVFITYGWSDLRGEVTAPDGSTWAEVPTLTVASLREALGLAA